MAGAQLEGELATVLGFVTFEYVGMQFELVVVNDQARVAVDRHQRRVARVSHQHVELAALPARTIAAGKFLDDPW
jgi:hypothetical protein